MSFQKKKALYAVSWGTNEDDPDYITSAVIKKISRPKKLVISYRDYLSKFGSLPFESDTPVSFTLKDQGNDTLLNVVQTGFPDEEFVDPYYQGCVKGWDDTLHSIRQVLQASE